MSLLDFIFAVFISIVLYIFHRNAFKRCFRNRRCGQWACKYFFECEYSSKRDKKDQ